ncbi:MAG: hypothetical protein AAF772_09315 [Acidobacteriota bacterium]
MPSSSPRPARPRTAPHLLRAIADVDAYAALFDAARACGTRIGWLCWHLVLLLTEIRFLITLRVYRVVQAVV